MITFGTASTNTSIYGASTVTVATVRWLGPDGYDDGQAGVREPRRPPSCPPSDAIALEVAP